MKTLKSGLFMLCLVPQLGFARGKKDSWENLNRLRPGEKIEVVDLQSGSHQGISSLFRRKQSRFGSTELRSPFSVPMCCGWSRANPGG
jgi:hypothetical protein